MAIFEDGFYAVKNGDMYKITLPEPVFKGAKTIKLQFRPETNADRVRSMTDEELARYIGHLVRQGRRQVMFDYECGLNWLRDEYDRFFFDEWLKKQGASDELGRQQT